MIVEKDFAAMLDYQLGNCTHSSLPTSHTFAKASREYQKLQRHRMNLRNCILNILNLPDTLLVNFVVQKNISKLILYAHSDLFLHLRIKQQVIAKTRCRFFHPQTKTTGTKHSSKSDKRVVTCGIVFTEFLSNFC